jgi:hypothetical protein
MSMVQTRGSQLDIQPQTSRVPRRSGAAGSDQWAAQEVASPVLQARLSKACPHGDPQQAQPSCAVVGPGPQLDSVAGCRPSRRRARGFSLLGEALINAFTQLAGTELSSRTDFRNKVAGIASKAPRVPRT